MLDEITELNVTNIVSHKTEDDVNDLIRLYAIVNTKDNVWLVSKTKQLFIENTKLLFVLGCKPGEGKMPYIKDWTQPSVDDVLFDVTGNLWHVKTVDWN